MNRMNRKIEYALMALKLMSNKLPGQLTTAKEVVDVTGVPFDATARVLQQMAQGRLLRSEQGVHGGYLIVKDLNKVNLLDLQEMVLGKVNLVKCSHDGNCELVDACIIQSPIQALQRRLTDFYRGVSLAELLRVKDHQNPAIKEERRREARAE